MFNIPQPLVTFKLAITWPLDNLEFEELAAIAPPESKGPPATRGNTSKRDKGRGRGKPHDRPARDRERDRRWERDNTR